MKDFSVNKVNKTVVKQDTKAAELVKGIHFVLFDGRLPNDWVYDTTVNILEKLHDYDHDAEGALRTITHEIADSLTEIYTHKLLTWAVDWHDEIDKVVAETEATDGRTLVEIVKLGQYLIIEKMVDYTINFVSKNKNKV